jgi:hypothetical protein
MAQVNPSYRKLYARLDREGNSYQLCWETIVFAGGNLTKDIGDPIQALIGILGDSDPRRRLTAISLICGNEGEFPEKRVAELLDDPDPAVRANAVYALGLRGTASAVPTIRRLTHDASGLVRYCAAEALRHLQNISP